MMQEMPTGWYTRRRAEKQFRPQPAQPYGHRTIDTGREGTPEEVQEQTAPDSK